ncbi:MAG: sulfur carrier protein ThiS [Bradymonadaceae bacterium]
MHVHINDEPRHFETDELTVEALLEALGIEERRGVALAVNKRVVPRSRWSDESIRDGDTVEIIRATQGG